MALILSLETSSEYCSVALHRDGELLILQQDHEQYKHSDILMSMISNSVDDIKTIDAVAISNGPGSYTGIRIGAATALGICHSLDKHFMAIDTLKSMAYHMSQHYNNDLFLPMLHAHTDKYYVLLVDRDMNTILPQQIMKLDEIKNLKYSNLLRFGNVTDENTIFITPMASYVGEMGWYLYSQSLYSDMYNYIPNYSC